MKHIIICLIYLILKYIAWRYDVAILSMILSLVENKNSWTCFLMFWNIYKIKIRIVIAFLHNKIKR